MTIEITGTGGIIEGNLGAANVNVNLDRALIFDGTDDYIDCGTDTDYDFTNNFTLAGWGKNDNATVTSREHIIAKYAGSSGNRIFRLVANGDDMEFTVGYNSGASFITVSHSGIDLSSWHHYAATFASGVMKLYVDGVEVVSTDHGPSGTNTLSAIHSNNSRAINIGSYQDGTGNHWQGNLADIRIYNAVLEQADIQLLASKINTDKSLGVGTTNLKGYWKLNNETASGGGSGTGFIVEESGNGQEGDLENFTGTYWDYDAYSVDVYDNSTTTDGTFTVTQGKVEGLALTSLAFDGTDDHVDATLPAGGIGSTFSISAWVRFDQNATSASDYDYAIAVGNGAGGVGEHVSIARFADSGGDSGKWYVFDGSVSRVATSVPAAATWHHVTVVGQPAASGDRLAIYVNGVGETIAQPTSDFSIDNTAVGLGAYVTGGAANFLDGNLRDVRIYDYALSAEQAASLYSGTYPQTPLHHWKINEGSGTAVEDYGTGTDADGTIDGATYTNGTLDLDGTLTIAANGTLSAPRGTVKVAGNFTNAGVYTHNSGTYENDGSNTLFTTNNSTYFNLTITDTIDNTVTTDTQFTIANNVTFASSKSMRLDDGVTINFGTNSVAATVVNNGIGFRGHDTGNVNAKLHGVSSLYPVVFSGSDHDWDHKANTNWYLKNIDIQHSFTTGGNTLDFILDGDCEFDAVTVDSGDTLDLNGQRAVFSSTLTANSGSTIDVDGMIIASGDLDIASATVNNSASATIIHTNSASKNTDLPDATFKAIAMLGSDEIEMMRSSNLGTTPIFIGGGGSSPVDFKDNITCGNFTIANGGVFNASGDTLTCSGDFTTSGGLIGKSAVVFDHDTSEVITSTLASAPSTAITLEAWVKSDDVTQYQTIITDRSQSVHLAIYNSKLYIWTDTDDSARVNVSGVTTLTNNKWHHLAMTWDAATDIMSGYVDGKLEISASSVGDNLGSISTAFAVGRREDVASQPFDGVIAMTRIFNVGRTQAQLRTDMFNDFANMSSTTGLLQMFQFDEGTGTSVDDVSANSNTGTITGASFAGAGTFTYGTSTLVMSGSNKNINFKGHTGVYDFNVSGTVTLNEITGGTLEWRLFGQNFTMGSGATLSSNNNEEFVFRPPFNGGTISLADPATNIANIFKVFCNVSSTLSLPELTTKEIVLDRTGGNVSATGNITLTEKLALGSGTTFNANGNTIAVKAMDLNNGGTLDLRNSTMNFSLTTDGDNIDLASGATLLTGNTTLTGNTSSQTSAIIPSAGNYEVVGDVSHFFMLSGSDLTVIGSVSNNTFQDSTANIRQFHHTLDTQQLLDADEAGDDDLKLEKPALDNAVELQTG